MRFHSEYGQDEWLYRNVFGDQCGGVFVEAGAMDGLLHSNSLFFELNLGWSGVLVEANPDSFAALAINRPNQKLFNCALGSSIGMVEMVAVSGTYFGWSAVTGSKDESVDRRLNMLPPSAKKLVTVTQRTLLDVLLSAGIASVDYLSLDVEGCELDVLEHFPFSAIKIDVIGVEDNDGSNLELVRLLLDAGYEHQCRIGVDDIWRRR